MSRQVARDESGFTLIEVLVALIILSISLAVILQIFSINLDRTRESQDEMIATSLAQSLLAQTGIMTPLRVGDTAGAFDNGFSWRLHVEPYGDGADQQAWPNSAFTVSVSAFWDGKHKSITLTTLRLGAKDAP